LSALVATAERDDDGLSATSEVDPVSGTVVDPKLGYGPTERFRIPDVSGCQAADPVNDVQDGALIPQSGQLARELRCFASFDHGLHM